MAKSIMSLAFLLVILAATTSKSDAQISSVTSLVRSINIRASVTCSVNGNACAGCLPIADNVRVTIRYNGIVVGTGLTVGGNVNISILKQLSLTNLILSAPGIVQNLLAIVDLPVASCSALASVTGTLSGAIRFTGTVTADGVALMVIDSFTRSL